MEYRMLGELPLGVIGLGCEYLEGMPEKEVREVVEYALEQKINLLDVFMSEPNVRTHIGNALAGRREAVHIQGHIGAIYENGQYARSRDLQKCKRAFEDLLTRLRTAYIDFGMLHYIDTLEDYEEAERNGLFAYAQSLREQGVVKKVGMSTHNPLTALRAIADGYIELVLFSINPAWDPVQPTKSTEEMREQVEKGAGGDGIDSHRAELYAACEAKGVGITVMKPYAAGILFDERQSPFGKAMTAPQCLHYALTRPGVVSVLPGCKSVPELSAALAYLNATPEERDYTMIAHNPRFSMTGKCMYCNHCLPCAANIDIAMVNKLYDLAVAQSAPPVPQTVRAHYEALAQNAADCIQCGQCEPNCPFGVHIMERMEKATELFS